MRAKFRVTRVTKHEGANQIEEVFLVPSNSKEGDNLDWSKWTPSGELRMQITQEGAQGQLKPGMHYWLDITPVVEAAPTTPAT